MKDYRIFVEGVADKRFIKQLIQHIFGVSVMDDCVIETEGYTNLISKSKTAVYVNQMRRTTDDGGVNLVVFDADDDYEKRKNEIMDWKHNHKLDFELFLFPNNHSNGEFEYLLESIINPENQPVMDCWEKYEESLKNVNIPWRERVPLTIPAKKTKIYAYLEVLLGSSKSEKKKIKECERDYCNINHWNLNATALTDLIAFFKEMLQ